MEISQHEQQEPLNEREIRDKILGIENEMHRIRERINERCQEVVAQHPVYGEMQAQRIAMEASFLPRDRHITTFSSVSMFTELVSSKDLYNQISEKDPEITRLSELETKLLKRQWELEKLLRNNLEYILEEARMMIVRIKRGIRELKKANRTHDLHDFQIRDNEYWIEQLEAALEEYRALVGDELN